MPRTAHVQDIRVTETSEGRFIVETYDDGMVVRRRINKGARPRRKPRKPIARAWRPTDKRES